MTQEEKAKAYDKAVNKLKGLMAQGVDPLITRADVQDFFPEIRESEDEKIRKAIIEFFELQDDNTTYSLVPKKDILAWLEKQTEVESDNDDIEAEEKGIRKAFNKIWDEKQGEQKNADKVEPKFKVGDWILYSGDHYEGVRHITKINENGYYIERNGLPHGIIPFNHEICMRLWTIQDAKDGDVLSNGKMIVIFKYFEDPSYRQHIVAHIGLDITGNIQITDGTWKLGIDKAKPATKEQRDLLFQKMHEFGYEWDAEKKELKLLITNGGDFFESENREQKPAWGEDNEKLTDVNHEYFSELLENDNSDNIDDYAYQVAYCMSHDWANETPTWDDVRKACKLGAEWNERRYKSNWDGENDELITAAICFIDSCNDNNGFACNGIYKDDVSKWLKSLR
jgi:co-chaperonin GroES (HSP10)